MHVCKAGDKSEPRLCCRFATTRTTADTTPNDRRQFADAGLASRAAAQGVWRMEKSVYRTSVALVGSCLRRVRAWERARNDPGDHARSPAAAPHQHHQHHQHLFAAAAACSTGPSRQSSTIEHEKRGVMASHYLYSVARTVPQARQP